MPGVPGQLCVGGGWGGGGRGKAGAVTAAGFQWPPAQPLVDGVTLADDVTFLSLSFFTVNS